MAASLSINNALDVSSNLSDCFHFGHIFLTISTGGI